MKTLMKITALAVIAVLTVFSCAPEPELSDVNWKDINSKYDPGKNSDYRDALAALGGEFNISGALSTGVNATNELDITFPASSDFLKAGKVSEAKLKEILSFYHFTKATEPIAGKADVLSAPLEYNLVRQHVNTFTVKLAKTFVASDSNVVMKIDGTKYTFGGGNKLDLVGRGRGGEAIYDDYYVERNVIGADGPSDFVAPGNKGWYLWLGSIDPDDANTAGILTRSPIAYLDLRDIEGEEANITTIATAVAGQLTGGLKIQKLVNGSWTDVSATITFDSDTNSFKVASLTLEDLVPFRVMWEGSAPVTTTATYYGVRQYIKIIGENTYDFGEPWLPAYYQTGKVYGPAEVWTKDGRYFEVGPTHVMIYKKDFNERNVVIEVLFNNGAGINDGENTYWLKNFNNDKQKFKDNFKIAYYKGYGGSVYDFTTRTDLVYIDIKDFEFFSHNPNKIDGIGLNAVRITLDPDYKLDNQTKYFYISPEICYTDGKTAMGDPNNFAHSFFKAYVASFANYFPEPPKPPAPPTPLVADVWADGTLDSYDDANQHSFRVTEGSAYLVWWNDYYDGDGTKTGDVSVSAQYLRGSTIFNGVDSGWTTPQMFIATQTGTVLIRVTPYYGYIGTYSIKYSEIDATPLTYDTWQDGEIATSDGEQWFRFTATTSEYQYIHATFGTLSYLYVELYDSNGSSSGRTTLYNSNPTAERYVTSGQTYYIKVWPYSGSGTYQITISTSNTRPNGTWIPPDASPTSLTLGVWADGEIATSDGEEWFRFTATATAHYIHASLGSLENLYVQVYDSYGNAPEFEYLYNYNLYTRQNVISDRTYYIKVWPYGSGSGTYQIAFNTSYTPPSP
jgi:hypothetical protein